jgi:hypothetical protein
LETTLKSTSSGDCESKAVVHQKLNRDPPVEYPDDNLGVSLLWF